MAPYRLIDELPGAKARRAPFSPLGLFFLTWFYWPVSVPFWFINWGRLGHPKPRGWTILGALLPFGLAIMLVANHVSIETVRTVGGVSKFGYAYALLFAQRPLHDAHLGRGGAKAAAWPLWIAALVGAVIQVATWGK